jgi:DNA-binding NarL/FixJ family response regulator
MAIRLVLADDHPLILDALQSLFKLEKDFEVVACCRDGVEAVHAVREHGPDILVLDVRMPGKDGLQVAWEIKAEKLPTRVVILTGEIDEVQVMDAIRIGVQGIVLKELAPKLLVQCIRQVYAGEMWIERRLQGQVLGKVLTRENVPQEADVPLTPGEMSVVRLVITGLRNKEIAERLFVSEGTVKVHLHNIYEKLKVNGRMALVRYMQEKQLM